MTTWEAEKDHEITEVLNYISALQSIAQKSSTIDGKDFYDEAQKIIPANLPSKHIWKIGMVAGLFYFPGDASHVRYDEVFYQAEKYCAILLSRRCDRESKHYLSLMQLQFGNDGGESLWYQNRINAQNKLCNK